MMRILGLVLAVALIAAACGDGDGGGESEVGTTVISTSGDTAPIGGSAAESRESETTLADQGREEPTGTTRSGDDLDESSEQPVPVDGGSGDDGSAGDGGDATEPDPGEPLPVLEDPKLNTSLTAMVETARADLAARLEVDPRLLTLIRAETVVWSDSSAGCRQPDTVYLQVLTEGARVILAHTGVFYFYHAGSDGVIAFCRNPSDPAFDQG